MIEEFLYTVILGLRPDLLSKKGKALNANETTDLDSKGYYLNRDLSMLEFNRRVFEMACDANSPAGAIAFLVHLHLQYG